MLVQCPHCGGTIPVSRVGRKPLNIVVNNVCDALRLHRSVLVAANSLGCSRAYIYKVLKANELTPAEAIRGSVTNDSSLLQNGELDDGRPK